MTKSYDTFKYNKGIDTNRLTYSTVNSFYKPTDIKWLNIFEPWKEGVIVQRIELIEQLQHPSAHNYIKLFNIVLQLCMTNNVDS